VFKITFYCFGKLKNKDLEPVLQDYVKRLSALGDFYYVQLKEEAYFEGEQSVQKALSTEAENLLNKLSKSDFVVLFDEKGVSLSSLEFSSLLTDAISHGDSIAFCVGSSSGFAETMYRRGFKMVSLSKLTLSYSFARVLAVEQIYRAIQIYRGHPYHRE
jgi:23S rRNA (pseudouridine1915-N3)-methyltransferase